MGIFFQMGIRFLYLKIGMEEIYLLLYLASILSGLYVPVGISRVIEKIKHPSARLLFGL
jgi:hypothetical protein